MSKHQAHDKFVFSRNDNIGASAAEDDSAFLHGCFVNTGDIDILLDCSDPRRLLIGRTGTGKSALMAEINSRSSKVIQLSPHSLSLNYIANNNVFDFFETLGVSLSAFYGLLWRHIFVVELLKKKFNIKNESSQKDYSRVIKNLFYKKDTNKEQAVDYLEKWGNKFWLTTEERIKEITERVEANLSASVKSSMPGLEFGAQGAATLSAEQKKEIIEHGQRAVSAIQIRELDNLISILADDIFTDPQEHYYLTIDMLDEAWAEERIKLKLIKALIETIRKFKQVSNVKVFAALRYDLLDKVIHSSREAGFQEEKYESLYLKLRWNKQQLFDLIEKRINHLIRSRYTKLMCSSMTSFLRKWAGHRRLITC